MASFPKDTRTRRGRPIPGPVSVVCSNCGSRGSVNKALGYKSNERIEKCARCKTKEDQK